MSMGDGAGANTGSGERVTDVPSVDPTRISQDPSVPSEAAGASRSEFDTPARLPEAGEDERGPLLPGERIVALRERWLVIQGKFVDQPREAVEQADNLIAEVIRELADDFALERSNLERQWDREQDVGTEDLRLACATIGRLWSGYSRHRRLPPSETETDGGA